jgi:hypothetical protein
VAPTTHEAYRQHHISHARAIARNPFAAAFQRAPQMIYDGLERLHLHSGPQPFVIKESVMHLHLHFSRSPAKTLKQNKQNKTYK